MMLLLLRDEKKKIKISIIYFSSSVFCADRLVPFRTRSTVAVGGIVRRWIPMDCSGIMFNERITRVVVVA